MCNENNYRFIFVDMPSTPVGPIEVSDVFADSMDLKWKPPEDDGGCPIEKYIVEKNDISQPEQWFPAGETTGNEPTHKVTPWLFQPGNRRSSCAFVNIFNFVDVFSYFFTRRFCL